MDPALFYPWTKEIPTQEVIDTCASCEVSGPCYEWALRYEVHGYWAGTSAADRRKLREGLGIVCEARPYQIWPRAGCGTVGGYNRHRRSKEEPCATCKEAHRRAVESRWPEGVGHSPATGKSHPRKKREEDPFQEDQDSQASLF
jgi:Transcription factor WhiB